MKVAALSWWWRPAQHTDFATDSVNRASIDKIARIITKNKVTEPIRVLDVFLYVPARNPEVQKRGDLVRKGFAGSLTVVKAWNSAVLKCCRLKICGEILSQPQLCQRSTTRIVIGRRSLYSIMYPSRNGQVLG